MKKILVFILSFAFLLCGCSNLGDFEKGTYTSVVGRIQYKVGEDSLEYRTNVKELEVKNNSIVVKFNNGNEYTGKLSKSDAVSDDLVILNITWNESPDDLIGEDWTGTKCTLEYLKDYDRYFVSFNNPCAGVLKIWYQFDK